MAVKKPAKRTGKSNRSSGSEDAKIGAIIRARRLDIRMSQERLAEIIGVTFQQVQKYEKGVNRIATKRLFDLLAALDMNFTDFVEKMDLKIPTNASTTSFPSNSREAELAVLFRKAPSHLQTRILALVKAVVNEHDS